MDKVALFYKFIKDRPQLFENSHDIFTPRELVESILNNVDTTGSILVLFNVEFVISLVHTYKVPPEMITLYSDHKNKDKIAQSLGCKVIKDFKSVLKFDVVIGNPPYQDSEDSGGALWSKFVNLTFKYIVKKNGQVVMIHPPSFIGKHLAKGKGKSDYTVFANNQIDQLHILDDYNRNRYFPGVGTRICWYIARKSPVAYETKIVGYDKENIYTFAKDFTKLTFLPNLINQVSISIHDKLTSSSSLKFTQKRELHYHTMKKKSSVSDFQSPTYQYKSYFSHKLVRYANFKFSDYDKIKVMVPQTSTVDNCFVDNNCNVSEDLFYVVCDSTETSVKVVQYLQSPLAKYIGKNYRPGRNLGGLLSSHILPDLNHSISWSNEELEYINANS